MIVPVTRIMKKSVIFFLLFFLTHFLNAQFNWVNKNMFWQKNFIENKGQFDSEKLPGKEHVIYATNIDGVEFYFTKNGYTIVKHEYVKRTEKEQEEFLSNRNHHSKEKKENGEEKEGNQYKTVKKYHELKFSETNREHSLIAEEEVSNYYSYSAPKHSKSGKTTITAHAYKRLIYKNIYPNTDIVFEFPKDSTGIKYSIYLHPGADVGNIKMTFPNEKFTLDKNNELNIESEFGKVIDHSPVSYIQNTNTFVKSNFIFFNNSIGFSVDKNNTSATIVIDPWTVIPLFTASSKAFDVDYDNLGNVYVYGEGDTLASELLKFSPTGTLIWSYVTPGFQYGDFAVDRNTNNIFMVEGFNVFGTGAQAIKINSSALVLASFSGDPSFNEMWRIAFDPCNKQAVIGGGGTSSPSYQTCLLDTELIALTPVSFVPLMPGRHDVGSLALDTYGNCYELTVRSNVDLVFDNVLTKLPVPSLSPATYSVNTNYSFREASSIQYFGVPGVGLSFNSYNGLTTSNTSLYSYDGYVLKKWDGPTGSLLNYKRISYPPASDSSLIYWGGISADNCGNLFLADNNIVRQYDSSLTLVNSYVMPDTITDLALSNTGLLYVCGINFVSSLVPSMLINCAGTSINTTSTNTSCGTLGTATAIITGGTPPYSITWNTSPLQFGATATNLSPGTYIVNAVDASCPPKTLIDTVVILSGGGYNLTTSQTNVTCNALGTGTANIIGGTGSFTYLWNPSGQTTAIAVGLTTGTYSVIVTDLNDGCTDTAYVSITNSGGPLANAGLDVTINSGSSTQLIATGGGSYQWSTGATTNSILVAPITTTIYCVTVTDANGCMDSACVKVFVEHPCPSLEKLGVPDAFSPNSDSKNDFFMLQGWTECTTEFTIFIYDRWGEMIYQSADVNFKWDGRFKGKTMDPAVFVYYIKATVNSSKVEKQGNITLIR
jgi:gliding motility-associated-like protein